MGIFLSLLQKISYETYNEEEVNLRSRKLLISFLVISVFLYLVGTVAVRNLQPPQERSQQSRRAELEQSKLDEVVDIESEDPSKLSNVVQGWGFKKVPKKKPQITSQQQRQIKEYNVIFTTDEKKKEVVLTFDLGYEEGYTSRILDTLKKHEVPATFFVTGAWLSNLNPKVDSKRLIKRMVKEGHLIGNHSWSHPSMPELDEKKFKEEIKKLENLIVKESGQNKKIKYFRPPKGEFSERTLYLTNKLGYKTTLWSIALLDWLPMPGGPQEAIDGVINNLHNGAVILLHGKSKDVVEGLDEMLTQIRKEGYKIVPLNKKA